MKKILIVVLFIIVSGTLLSLFIGHTIVIDTYASVGAKNDTAKNHAKGDTVSVSYALDFNYGKWGANLILSEEVQNSLPTQLRKRNCYRPYKITMLKSMQKNSKVLMMGGDIATATNKLLLFKDNEIFFPSGVLLAPQTQELQNEQIG